jgi:hypothetical protein
MQIESPNNMIINDSGHKKFYCTNDNKLQITKNKDLISSLKFEY